MNTIGKGGKARTSLKLIKRILNEKKFVLIIQSIHINARLQLDEYQ
jgi:hypothetical protein